MSTKTLVFTTELQYCTYAANARPELVALLYVLRFAHLACKLCCHGWFQTGLPKLHF